MIQIKPLRARLASELIALFFEKNAIKAEHKRKTAITVNSSCPCQHLKSKNQERRVSY